MSQIIRSVSHKDLPYNDARFDARFEWSPANGICIVQKLLQSDRYKDLRAGVAIYNLGRPYK